MVFAVGIEDTFIVTEAPGRRKLDEYELTQHTHYWHADLGLAAETGASAIRWGIPWYRVNPERGVWDFSWIDRVVDRFDELDLDPIIDLVHYGCPTWLDNAFAHPDYPERVAEYGARVAERYAGRVTRFTPLNEPLLNVIYTGEFGIWPPHLTGDTGFTTVLGQIARGIVTTQSAIAETGGAETSFVHVEAAYRFSGDTSTVEDRVRFLRDRAYIVEDLVTGKVDADHPLADWLSRAGFRDDAFQWHLDNVAIPDVMGVNYYPAVSTEAFRAGDNARGTLDDPLPRVNEGVAGLEEVVRAFAGRYGRPVMITETSIGGDPDARIAWLDESVAAAYRLRDDGVPVVGYTWWAVFDWLDWAYREQSAPVETYLCRQGLWDLNLDASGVLRRDRTRVADRFLEHARAAR